MIDPNNIQVIQVGNARNGEYDAEDTGQLAIEVNGEFHAVAVTDTVAEERIAELLNTTADAIQLTRVGETHEDDMPSYADAAWNVTVTKTTCPHCGNDMDTIDLEQWGHEPIVTCTDCHQATVHVYVADNIYDPDENVGDMPRCWGDANPELAETAWNIAEYAADTADGDQRDIGDAAGVDLPDLIRRCRSAGIAAPAGYVIDGGCEPTTDAEPVKDCTGRCVTLNIVFGRPGTFWRRR